MSGVLWTPAMERGTRLQCWLDADDTRTVERFHNSSFGERQLQLVYDKAQGHLASVSAIADDRRPQWVSVREANYRHMIKMWQTDYVFLDANGEGAMIDNPFSIGSKGTVILCVGMVREWQGGTIDSGNGTYLIDRAGNLGNPLMSIKCDTSGFWCIQMRDNGGTGINNSPMTTRSIVGGRMELFSIAHTSASTTPVTHRVWAAGTSVYAANPSGLGMITLQYPRIGYGAQTTAASDAYVGEYIVCNDGEDDRLRQRIEGYLAHKWNIRLATNHPYYNRPPLSVGGSSLLLGNTYASQLQAVDGAKLRSTINGARARFLLG